MSDTATEPQPTEETEPARPRFERPDLLERAQPGPARGRRPRRRAAADRGRRRLGQDPGPHPPHRPPDPRPGRLAVRDPRHHVHQQGGGRDEAAGSAALVGPVAQKMWVSTFHSACVRILRRDGAAARATRRRSRSTTRPTRSGSRATCSATSTSTPSGSRPGRCTPSISAAKNELRRRRRVRATGARTIFERRIAEVYREYQDRLLQGRGHGLRRPARGQPVELFREHPDVARALPAAVPAHPGRRVPGHQPRSRTSSCCCSPPSTATSASWATTTSRSTGSAAPTSATSSSSRRRSPTPP